MRNFWQPYRDLFPTYSDWSFFVPTLNQIDQAQADLGLALPESYQQFVLSFGQGVLGVKDGEEQQEYHVAVPGARGQFPADGDPVRLKAEFARMFLAEGTPGMESVDKAVWARSERLVPFCYSGRYEAIFWGWDPEEVTDVEGHEYAIYEVRDEGLRPFTSQRVAASFTEFVLEVVFRGRFEEFAALLAASPPPVRDEEDDDLDHIPSVYQEDGDLLINFTPVD